MKGRAVAVVVMGVSGSGKSSVGQALAARIACPFLEGDAFHPAASVDKMSQGIPLDDADRWPWLDRLGSALADAVSTHGIAVAACSALTRAYRDRLRAGTQCPTAFAHLIADRNELDRRMRTRPGHYMPASLLDSQLTLLEPPTADECARGFATTGGQPPVDEDIARWVSGLTSYR